MSDNAELIARLLDAAEFANHFAALCRAAADALAKTDERIAELEELQDRAILKYGEEMALRVEAAARVKALEIAAVRAVEPLEALRLLGPLDISGELWAGIVEGCDAVRAALSQSGEG